MYGIKKKTKVLKRKKKKKTKVLERKKEKKKEKGKLPAIC